MSKEKYSDILQKRVDALNGNYKPKIDDSELQPEMFWPDIPKISLVELKRLSKLEIKNE